MARRTKLDESLPTSLQEAVDRLEDPKAALVAIVDRAVRDSRDNGWCDSFESIMRRAVPELAVSHAYSRETGGAGSTWVDSDGNSCNGYDREGYHMTVGTHFSTGLTRDGYDREGFNADGVDRNGFDRYGVNPNDPSTKFRFDRWGLDADGFDYSGRRGYYRGETGVTRANLALMRAQHEFVYDRDGNRNPEAPASE